MSRLQPETRALVDVVLETLTLPYGATTADEEIRTGILLQRVMHLQTYLHLIADTDLRVEVAAAHMRERLLLLPAVGYVTLDEAQARLEAGANWAQAVSQDYEPPAAQDEDGVA